MYNQLKNSEHFFVKIVPGEKRPEGIAWQLNPIEWEQQPDKSWKNRTTGETYKSKTKGEEKTFYGEPANYKHDNKKLVEYEQRGERIGILLGITGIIDVELEGTKDNSINKHFTELEKIAEELPETLTIKTPSGGIRRLYKNKELKTNISLKHYSYSGEHPEAELRGAGQSVILGTGYQLITDAPIAEITLEELKTAFYDYLEQEREQSTKINSEKIRIPITAVISTSNFTSRGNGEYQGTHPKHGSSHKKGWNFAFNTNKDTWYCHSAGHENGGDTLSLIAVMEGIIDCSDAKNGLRGENFLKTLEIAKTKYGYKEPSQENKEKIDKTKIAKNEEWDFQNTLPEDHFASQYIKKGKAYQMLTQNISSAEH